jgi:hypothetical protein
MGAVSARIVVVVSCVVLLLACAVSALAQIWVQT